MIYLELMFGKFIFKEKFQLGIVRKERKMLGDFEVVFSVCK